MPTDADVELVKVASTQCSRFSLAQAIDCGVPKSTLYERVGRGRYGNPLPTVFALEGAEDTEPGRVTEALLYGGPDAIVSHHSAARLYGFREMEDDETTHIIVPGRRRDSVGHVRGHASHDARENDV